VYKCKIFFIQSSIDVYLDWFHNMAIVNSAIEIMVRSCSILSWYWYRVKGKDLFSVFCMEVSSFLSIICLSFFFSNVFFHLCLVPDGFNFVYLYILYSITLACVPLLCQYYVVLFTISLHCNLKLSVVLHKHCFFFYCSVLVWICRVFCVLSISEKNVQKFWWKLYWICR
jgi:hypothetical protein